jgi:hypothetical protein
MHDVSKSLGDPMMTRSRALTVIADVMQLHQHDLDLIQTTKHVDKSFVSEPADYATDVQRGSKLVVWYVDYYMNPQG